MLEWKTRGPGKWSANSYAGADGAYFQWRIAVADDGKFEIVNSDDQLLQYMRNKPAPYFSFDGAKAECESAEALIVDAYKVFPDPSGDVDKEPDLDLRDRFAMAALTGMLAYPGDEMSGSCHNNSTFKDNAEVAYEYANAMLEARK